MSMFSQRVRIFLLMLCSAAALSACGGSDGPAPVPVPTAVADVAVVNRDGNASVPVLANDSVTHGGRLKLVSATTPAHGTATISGDAIVYTPAAGYIGADSFSYTVKDVGEGAATSTAQVAITVNGAFGLIGRVTEALRGSANISINVGAKSFTGVAADGFYSIAISSSNVDDMITVTATGTGEQAHLKLVSLAGDLKTAAAAAGGVQQLNPGQLPGLNVGSVSTALYALATRKNGGVVPATQQALAGASSAVSAGELVQMAALVRMAAMPAQLPLPAGAPDTLALVTNQALYTQFARATLRTQAATVQQVSAGLALDPILTVQPLVRPTTAAKSLNFFSSDGCCAMPATELVLHPNGTGEVSGEQGRMAGTWIRETNLLRLTLAQPAVTLAYEDVQVNGQPRQVQVRREIRSYEVRQLTGSADQGLAVLVRNGSVSYPDGELAPGPLSSSTVFQFREWAAIAALAAADVGGITYAGIVDTIIAGITGTAQTSQFFAADGTGRRFFDGDTSWKIEDGKLVTSTRNGDGVLVQTLARLRVAPDGEERWLVRVALPGGGYQVYEALMVKQQSGLAMTPALAVNRWRSRAGSEAIAQELHINVRGDGIAEEQLYGLDGSLSTIRSTTWTASGASLTMDVWNRPDGTVGGTCPYLFGCTLVRSRGWTLLRTTGDTMFVMENLFVNGQNLRRVNRYERAVL